MDTARSHSSISSRSSFRSVSPPFGLDEDEISIASRNTTSSKGYREGGPKEARLKRVALLSKVKEVDHLYPVKVTNIPKTASPSRLSKMFESLPSVEDIYIPTNYSNGKPSADFAVIRLNSPEKQEAMLNSGLPFSDIEGRQLSVSQVKRQRSFFSGGTGFHGICNQPVDDGTYNRDPILVTQDISLSSCLSRSGYPWGSVRELKFLSPHIPVESYDAYIIRIENVPRHIKSSEIENVFKKYGEIVCVTCPKSLVVTDQTKEANHGFAFVRFVDIRDRDAAEKDIEKGLIRFDDQIISGKALIPSFWPTEKTRRYY